MSQPSNTPAWGTPVNPAAGNVAETQVLPPVSQVAPRPIGPTRAEVELRVTALHYATRLLGDQPIASPDDKVANVTRAAKKLESYLLTGDASGI